MKNYNELLQFFNAELKNQKINLKPNELYEPINYTLELGGKRIRPLLCLMACEIFGTDAKQAINQAIAIEFFHNFTLIHDDIMDNALLRRGKKSVYKKWNKNIAILSGDTLFALAYKYAQSYHPDQIHSILSIFISTAIQVCEGQQYDLNFENKKYISVNDYLNMIQLKTAVLFGASLKIGAQIGGASESNAQNLYEFGINIGIGFQLKDDLLDVYGDQNVFGKIKGGDIIKNKKTYLYIKALEIADEEQRKELILLYNSLNIDNNEKIQRVTNLYNQLGIKEIVNDFIQIHYKKGLENLEKLNVEENRLKDLKNLAQKMIVRKN